MKLVSQAREARPDDSLAALLHVQTALRLEAFDDAEKALAAETLADHPAAALLRLELASRQDRSDSIGSLSMEAAGALGALQVPYACRACGKALDEWAAQCPACERYDTIQLVWVGKASLPEAEAEVAADTEDQKSEKGPPS